MHSDATVYDFVSPCTYCSVYAPAQGPMRIETKYMQKNYVVSTQSYICEVVFKECTKVRCFSLCYLHLLEITSLRWLNAAILDANGHVERAAKEYCAALRSYLHHFDAAAGENGRGGVTEGEGGVAGRAVAMPSRALNPSVVTFLVGRVLTCLVAVADWQTLGTWLCPFLGAKARPTRETEAVRASLHHTHAHWPHPTHFTPSRTLATPPHAPNIMFLPHEAFFPPNPHLLSHVCCSHGNRHTGKYM